MLLSRASLILGLALALLVQVQTAQADKGGKKKGGHHGVRGVVLDVTQDKDKNSSTLTVKVHQHKKKAAAAAPAQETEKKFRITEATKVERVTGSKGAREHKPATLAEVRKGEHVVVIPAADNANGAKAVLLVAKHKKKAKAQQ
jgi:hypothetical protein